MFNKALTFSFFNLIRLALIFVAVWLVLFGFYLTKTQHYFPVLPEDNSFEAIVVLTGGTDRIDEGLSLLRKKVAARLFISGVHQKVLLSQIPVADLRCCVELGYEAHNTKQNADETKIWLEKNKLARIVLITSDYHMPRALDVFEKILPPTVKVTPYAVPFIARHQFKIITSAQWARLVVTEYHKFLLQRITGIMEI